MQDHINLRITHRLLWRLYAYRAVISIICGLGIIIAPNIFVGSPSYDVFQSIFPQYTTGGLWLICGVLIAYGLQRGPYYLAKIGIGLSAALYFSWGVGILATQITNPHIPLALFAVLAYVSLAVTSFLMLLEPPINPMTAIKKHKER